MIIPIPIPFDINKQAPSSPTRMNRDTIFECTECDFRVDESECRWIGEFEERYLKHMKETGHRPSFRHSFS